MSRNPRRAYDRDGTPFPPATIANIREQGVNSLLVSCAPCGRNEIVRVETWPADAIVPDAVFRLRCSVCGQRPTESRPNWTELRVPGMGKAHP